MHIVNQERNSKEFVTLYDSGSYTLLRFHGTFAILSDFVSSEVENVSMIFISKIFV